MCSSTPRSFWRSLPWERWRARPSGSPETRLLALLGLWLACAGASILASTHPQRLLIRLDWTPLALGLVLLLAVCPSRVLVVRCLAAATITALAFDMAYQGLTGANVFGFIPYPDRLNGFLPHPNDAALVAVLLPFAPVVAWPVGLAVIAASVSRNAALGAVVAMFMLANPRQRLALVLLILVAVLLYAHQDAELFTRGKSRLGQWLVAVSMWRDAPILGHGPGSYGDHYLRRLDTLRPLPLGVKADRQHVMWAHNLYLEQLAERGLAGFIALLLPLAAVLRDGSRQTRAAVAALLVMGLFDLTFLKPWVVGAVWGLVALGKGEA